jgi:hypothetical protein
VPTLSKKDTKILADRGISIEVDDFGAIINITTTGVFWLLNYFDKSKKCGKTISLKLLKDISNFQLDESFCRELRIKSISLPVDDEVNYFWVVFYLNGTPPRALQSFKTDCCSIPQKLSIPISNNGPLRIRNDQTAEIALSQEEINILKEGKIIVVEAALIPP